MSAPLDRRRWRRAVFVATLALARAAVLADAWSSASSLGALTQQAYLKARNPDGQDRFGRWVAISGDRAVVGAVNEGGSGRGVNPTPDNNGPLSGAAYVFVRSNGVWQEEAYLKASNANNGDRFGASVAISGDTIVVGAYAEASGSGSEADNSAPNAGAAYVFVRTGGGWVQQAYLKAVNAEAEDFFGWSVAIAGDVIVVGAWGEDSTATGVNGNGSNNGAAQAGAAYVFRRTGGTWSQEAYLKSATTAANNLFGGSVAVSDQVVAVSGDNATHVFASGSWAPLGRLAAQSGTARCAAGLNPAAMIAASSDTIVVGGSAPCVFRRAGSGWQLESFLVRPVAAVSDGFGFSVGLSGDLAIVGAPFADTAYVFERAGTAWTPAGALRAANADAGDNFGHGVAVAGATFVVGAQQESSLNGAPGNNSAFAAGAAYVFVPGSSGDAPPGSPLLTGTIAGSLVALQWQPGLGGAPGGYTLQVATDAAFTQLIVNQSVGLSQAISGTVPPNFVAYARVIAANGAGQAVSNVFAVETVGPCGSPPSAPTALQATKNESSVTVSWNASPGATAYRIEADVSGASTVINVSLGNVTSVTGSGLAAGSYTVRVFAANGCGESPGSSASFVIP